MTISSILPGLPGINLTVTAGVTLEVLAGGSAISTDVDDGGQLQVLSGGVASTTSVASGGADFVFAGGLASFTTVDSGGTEYVSGGTTFATLLSDGGVQSVLSGGVVSATTVDSGGAVYLSNASAVDTMVNSGGQEYVLGGGVATHTVAGDFGFVFVRSGGTVSGATVEGGGNLSVSGGNAVATVLDSNGVGYIVFGATATGTEVGSDASLFISSGGTASNTSVQSGGTAYVSGGSAVDTTIDGGGTLVLSGGGAQLTGGVVFAGNGADLVIYGTSLPTTTLSDFAGGTIDLASLAGATASLDVANDLMTITAGGASYNLQLGGSYTTGQTVESSPDAGSGTDLMLACFAAGTLIRTPLGEIPVEALAPGDLVITSGGVAPVRWLTVQPVSRRFADKLQAQPIRIRAGALDDNVPSRDLVVSPGHALLIDGLLVQANALVNGTSIARVADLPEVFNYYHLVLPAHAVIFAEAAPAESFLDGVEAFAITVPAHGAPDSGATPLPYPRIKAHRQVPAAMRQGLAARAVRLAGAMEGAAA